MEQSQLCQKAVIVSESTRISETYTFIPMGKISGQKVVLEHARIFDIL